jgi:nucleotidyltransferase substrate binding protein (TIGR01987 family)
MEQAREKLEAHINLLEKAGNTLQEVLSVPFNDIVRDATIQRFEYVFELSWKTIQMAADYMGSSLSSPREAIKTAFKLGWIKNPDGWFEALEARNKTSHTYNVVLAKEVWTVASRFPKLLNELLPFLKEILKK